MTRRVAIAGAGQGIGAACARALAREGARLVLCARTQADVARVAREIVSGGGEATALAADVTTDAGAAAFAEAAFGALGGVDLALICVGAGHEPSLVQDADRALFVEALVANAVGPALVAGALLRAWESRSRAQGLQGRNADGHVLVLSSLATQRPPQQFAGPYTAAKAALESLVRTIAAESWPRARVNALCLGPVATRLHARTPPEIVAQLPSPDEIAPLVLRAAARLAGQSGRVLDAEALSRSEEAALAGGGQLAFVEPLQRAGEPEAEPEPGRSPSPRVRAALRGAADAAQKYPQHTDALRARLAALHGVEPTQVLLSGGGATELVERALRALCAPGDEVVSPFPTFEVLSALASREGVRHRPVPAPRTRDGLFGPHAAAPLVAAVGPRTRLVYVASPDNPTGAQLAAAEEQRLRAALPAGAALVVDEAWSLAVEGAAEPSGPAPATSKAAAPAPAKEPSLAPVLRIRSFSKLHGLASLRIGYAIASPSLAGTLRRLELPFPLGAPQVAAALAVLGEPARARRAALLLARERRRTADALRSLGLAVSAGDAPVLVLRERAGTNAGALTFALRAAGAAAGEASWDPSACVLGLGSRAQNRRAIAAVARLPGRS